MNATLLIYIAASLCAGAVFSALGALIYRAGVKQGQLTAKIAWNLQRGADPMDDIDTDDTDDPSPGVGECE